MYGLCLLFAFASTFFLSFAALAQDAQKVELNQKTMEVFIDDMVKQGLIGEDEAQAIKYELEKVTDAQWKKYDKNFSRVTRSIAGVASSQEEAEKKELNLVNKFDGSGGQETKAVDFTDKANYNLIDNVQKVEAIFVP